MKYNFSSFESCAQKSVSINGQYFHQQKVVAAFVVKSFGGIIRKHIAKVDIYSNGMNDPE